MRAAVILSAAAIRPSGSASPKLRAAGTPSCSNIFANMSLSRKPSRVGHTTLSPRCAPHAVPQAPFHDRAAGFRVRRQAVEPARRRSAYFAWNCASPVASSWAGDHRQTASGAQVTWRRRDGTPWDRLSRVRALGLPHPLSLQQAGCGRYSRAVCDHRERRL